MEGDFEGNLEGDFRGDFKQDMEGLAVKLRSGKVHVRSGPGLVQFTAQIYSFELDSEVGRLVLLLETWSSV